MRTIRKHIVHASATPNNMDIGAHEIRQWHLAQKWADIGYHFVIRRDGTLERGRPLENIGSHVKGHNTDSIGTCLVGAGRSIKDFTPAQLATLRVLDMEMRRQFKGLTTHGHNEFTNAKTCPGFKMGEVQWLHEPQPSLPPLSPSLWQRVVAFLKRA